MKHHKLSPSQSSMHGKFNRELKPAIEVNAGDIISVSTIDITWGVEQHGYNSERRKRFEPRSSPKDDGPALTGPISIKEANVGDLLRIKILELIPENWGWTWAGDSLFNDELNKAIGIESDSHLIRWKINNESKVATSEDGFKTPLKPFLGTIGMPDNVQGWQEGWTPRLTGGNMDCQEITIGSTLFLPIKVKNGLLSLGDAHAYQANGEICGSAIECGLKEARLQLDVIQSDIINYPLVEKEKFWTILGFGETLDDAIKITSAQTVDFISRILDWKKSKATAYCSIYSDFRITQVVNGTVGVHANISKDLVSGFGYECL